MSFALEFSPCPGAAVFNSKAIRSPLNQRPLIGAPGLSFFMQASLFIGLLGEVLYVTVS